MITIDRHTTRECTHCGETTTIEADERLCADCLEAAELENAHEDGDHDDHGYADPKCRSCNGGVLSAAQRERSEMSPDERAAARGDYMRDMRKDEDR